MEIKVTFQPSGRSVHVLPGTLLLEAAGLAGIILQTPCGGQGTCGKCRVVMSGEDALACQVEVTKDIVVEIPEGSMFESRQRILVEHTAGAMRSHKPRVSSKGALGIAFDIGTTTVAGTLFDLHEGRELGVACELNGQIVFGDDVVSRIQKVCEEPAAILSLRGSIVETVNRIIKTLCSDAGVEVSCVEDIVIAGNSTMQQIFCGMDISGLGMLPFKQAFKEAQMLTAREAGVTAADDAQVYVFPQIDGFVGGDTVAGMVASRLDEREGAILFIDIGTNGEIVLSAGGRILTASTAAGPAFEGARIKQGMRAVPGAIEKVIIGDSVECNVIGSMRPVGICGTALIDAVAGLLDVGVVDETGRILSGDELPSDLSDNICKRVIMKNGMMAFTLVEGVDTASGKRICIWQKDIRELQLAAGAIRAGINILMRIAGIAAADLSEILLAGGFGNFIRRNNALRIGLLPSVLHERIKFVGNSALLGSKLALLSIDERDYAEQLRKRAEHVDLSMDIEFQNEFAMAMMFPDSAHASRSVNS